MQGVPSGESGGAPGVGLAHPYIEFSCSIPSLLVAIITLQSVSKSRGLSEAAYVLSADQGA